MSDQQLAEGVQRFLQLGAPAEKKKSIILTTFTIFQKASLFHRYHNLVPGLSIREALLAMRKTGLMLSTLF